MFVSKKYHDTTFPSIISHTSDGFPNLLQRRFSWMGTIDYSKFVVVSDAIDYYDGIGGFTKIHEHCTTLKNRVCAHLSSLWTTKIIDSDIFMCNIMLPVVEGFKYDQLLEKIWSRFCSYVPVYNFDGAWWIRICFQVYNRFEDYEQLGKVILEIFNMQNKSNL